MADVHQVSSAQNAKFFNLLRNRQNRAEIQKEIQQSDQESQAKLFNRSSLNTQNAMPLPVADMGKLSEAPFLSREMGVYVEIVVENLLANNPMLSEVADQLAFKLDDLLDSENVDNLDNVDSMEDNFALVMESPEFVNLSNFECYMLLYEYYLKRKRKSKSKKLLPIINNALGDFESSNTIEIVENLAVFNAQVLGKLNTIQDIKAGANSYHGEYSNIFSKIDQEYSGNYKALIKDLIRLNAYNTHNATESLRDGNRAYEQKAFLVENVRYETKLLSVMSLLCKLEEVKGKVAQFIPDNMSSFANDIVDLLDGFDGDRLLNTKCKTLGAEEKKRIFYALLNGYMDTIRYLPNRFFKQVSDRDQLNTRLSKCSFKDTVDPTMMDRFKKYF